MVAVGSGSSVFSQRDLGIKKTDGDIKSSSIVLRLIHVKTQSDIVNYNENYSHIRTGCFAPSYFTAGDAVYSKGNLTGNEVNVFKETASSPEVICFLFI